MDFLINWTESALLDLEEIVRYISRDDPAAARRIGEGVIDSVEQLRTFPKSGRVVPETSEECVREVLYSPYRIVYELHDQEGSISIVRVWHAARGSIEWT